MSIPVIAQVLSILIIAGWLVYKEIHERNKSRAYGLPENPERCHDHEQRLRGVEAGLADLKTEVKVMAVKVEGVSDRLDNIGRLFNEAGDHV